MEQEIRSRFSDNIVRYGAALYGVTIEDTNRLDGSMNFVFEYQRSGIEYILRFTPAQHRSRNLVQAELEWIRYLDHHGLTVSIPVESIRGKLVEYYESNDCFFIISSFLKATGKAIPYPDCLHDHELYYKIGLATGKLHRLSKLYTPSTKAFQREDWRHNYYLTNMRTFIPSDQIEVIEGCKSVISALDELPIHSESYGLIHGDINTGNFRADDTGITLFDFDEAHYSWFINDIVTPMYYLIFVYGGDDVRALRESQASRFMEHYMKGYSIENVVDDYWISKIPLFLRLREIIVYIGMYKNCPDISTIDQWGKDFMAESRIRIEKGISIVDIWG